jgi:hypothetical protein
VAFVPVGAANAAELETKLNQLLKPTT